MGAVSRYVTVCRMLLIHQLIVWMMSAVDAESDLVQTGALLPNALVHQLFSSPLVDASVHSSTSPQSMSSSPMSPPSHRAGMFQFGSHPRMHLLYSHSKLSESVSSLSSDDAESVSQNSSMNERIRSRLFTPTLTAFSRTRNASHTQLPSSDAIEIESESIAVTSEQLVDFKFTSTASPWFEFDKLENVPPKSVELLGSNDSHSNQVVKSLEHDLNAAANNGIPFDNSPDELLLDANQQDSCTQTESFVSDTSSTVSDRADKLLQSISTQHDEHRNEMNGTLLKFESEISALLTQFQLQQQRSDRQCEFQSKQIRALETQLTLSTNSVSEKIVEVSKTVLQTVNEVLHVQREMKSSAAELKAELVNISQHNAQELKRQIFSEFNDHIASQIDALRQDQCRESSESKQQIQFILHKLSAVEQSHDALNCSVTTLSSPNPPSHTHSLKAQNVSESAIGHMLPRHSSSVLSCLLALNVFILVLILIICCVLYFRPRISLT
jgi:hypothetical protein